MFIETNLTDKRIREYTSKGYWEHMTVGDYLDENIKKYPNKIAIVDPKGRRVTYKELGRMVNRIALGFLKMGIKKGDIISVQLPNWIEFEYTYFALSKIGAIMNPLAATYRQNEVYYILKFSESKAVIITDEFRHFNYLKMMEEVKPKLPSLQHIFVIGESIPSGMLSFSEFTARCWEDECELKTLEQNKPNANDILVLMYTSGTEAEPKGVLHTHNTIIFGEKSFAQALEISAEDTCFMASPISHASGFAHGVNLPMIVGGKTVLLDIWDPEDALKLIEKEKCTFSMGATPFVRMILDCPNLHKYDISSMRCYLCGGAPIPREMVTESSKIGLKVLAVYGLTESIPHTVNRLNDPPEKIYGTDGKPCPGIEVKIVDDNLKELPIGETGEEASRGPNICVGYFKQPEINKKSFDEEGWFYSGDLCRMDKDGYIIVEGRKKDIIIRGGQNISVKEIEDLLYNHHKIGNVAIVAMPDRRMGEKACAFVIPKAGESITLEEVVSFLSEKKVAKFKLPERIEVVGEFPTTPSGKIQKYLLRKDLTQKIEMEERTKNR